MKIKLSHIIEALNQLRWDITYREKLYLIDATIEISEESIQDGRMLSCLTLSCESNQGLDNGENLSRKICVFSSEDNMLPIISTIKSKTISIDSDPEN